MPAGLDQTDEGTRKVGIRNTHATPKPRLIFAVKSGKFREPVALTDIQNVPTPLRPASPSNGRLLLCNISGIGDTILRNSILDSAARTYRTVDYLCGVGNVGLLQGDPRLNRVMVLDKSPAGLVRLIMTAWFGRYDAFIGLKDHRSSTDLTMARLFRSRVKTGWNSDRRRPFDRDIRGVVSPDAHVVETTRRIGELAGLMAGEYKPSLILAPESVQWFRQNHAWDKPFNLLNVSATHPHRLWPAANWARYVRGCGLEHEPLLVNGLPRHQAMVEELCAALPGAKPLLPRRFMDVAAAISDAQRVLTVDTGVVHACSALDKPIVALFCAGQSLNGYGPLSTRQLVIEAPPGGKVPDIDPERAIAETRRRGLP
jgi:heptosyltransferase II